MVAAQLQSPLMRLPPELRNRIYEEVFAGATYSPCVYYGDRIEPSYRGILHACKHTLKEAEIMYWNSVVLRFWESDGCERFMGSIDERGTPHHLALNTTDGETYLGRVSRAVSTPSGYTISEVTYRVLRKAAQVAEKEMGKKRSDFAKSRRSRNVAFGAYITTTEEFAGSGKFNITWTGTPVETLEREFKTMERSLKVWAERAATKALVRLNWSS